MFECFSICDDILELINEELKQGKHYGDIKKYTKSIKDSLNKIEIILNSKFLIYFEEIFPDLQFFFSNISDKNEKIPKFKRYFMINSCENLLEDNEKNIIQFIHNKKNDGVYDLDFCVWDNDVQIYLYDIYFIIKTKNKIVIINLETKKKYKTKIELNMKIYFCQFWGFDKNTKLILFNRHKKKYFIYRIIIIGDKIEIKKEKEFNWIKKIKFCENLQINVFNNFLKSEKTMVSFIETNKNTQILSILIIEIQNIILNYFSEEKINEKYFLNCEKIIKFSKKFFFYNGKKIICLQNNTLTKSLSENKIMTLLLEKDKKLIKKKIAKYFKFNLLCNMLKYEDFYKYSPKSKYFIKNLIFLELEDLIIIKFVISFLLKNYPELIFFLIKYLIIRDNNNDSPQMINETLYFLDVSFSINYEKKEFIFDAFKYVWSLLDFYDYSQINQKFKIKKKKGLVYEFINDEFSEFNHLLNELGDYDYVYCYIALKNEKYLFLNDFIQMKKIDVYTHYYLKKFLNHKISN